MARLLHLRQLPPTFLLPPGDALFSNSLVIAVAEVLPAAATIDRGSGQKTNLQNSRSNAAADRLVNGDEPRYFVRVSAPFAFFPARLIPMPPASVGCSATLICWSRQLGFDGATLDSHRAFVALLSNRVADSIHFHLSSVHSVPSD